MPAKPTWLLQLPNIIAELKEMSVPFLDRPAIEKLFAVRRRRALQLMTEFGVGLVVGKTFLIDRLQLLARLEATMLGDDFEFEQNRKERITSALERSRKEIRGRRILIETHPTTHDRMMTDLPTGIHLKPGELRIEFDGTEELLRKLFELSQAIVNDYDKFNELSGMPG